MKQKALAESRTIHSMVRMNTPKIAEVPTILRTSILQNPTEFSIRKTKAYKNLCRNSEENEFEEFEESFDLKGTEKLLQFGDLILDFDYYDNQQISYEEFERLMRESPILNHILELFDQILQSQHRNAESEGAINTHQCSK